MRLSELGVEISIWVRFGLIGWCNVECSFYQSVASLTECWLSHIRSSLVLLWLNSCEFRIHHVSLWWWVDLLTDLLTVSGLPVRCCMLGILHDSFVPQHVSRHLILGNLSCQCNILIILALVEALTLVKNVDKTFLSLHWFEQCLKELLTLRVLLILIE